MNTIDIDVHVLGDTFGGQVRVDDLQSLMSSAGLSPCILSTPIVSPIQMIFSDSFTSETSIVQPYSDWYLGRNEKQTTLNDLYNSNSKLLFVNKLNGVASSQQFMLFIEH